MKKKKKKKKKKKQSFSKSDTKNLFLLMEQYTIKMSIIRHNYLLNYITLKLCNHIYNCMLFVAIEYNAPTIVLCPKLIAVPILCLLFASIFVWLVRAYFYCSR